MSFKLCASLSSFMKSNPIPLLPAGDPQPSTSSAPGICSPASPQLMVQDHWKQMTHLLKHHQKVSSLLYHKAYINQFTSHYRHFRITTSQEEGWVHYKIFWQGEKKKGHIITFITVYFMISYCCSSLSVSNLSIKLSHRYVYGEKTMVCTWFGTIHSFRHPLSVL